MIAGIFILLWRPPAPRKASWPRRLAIAGLVVAAVASLGAWWIAVPRPDPRDPKAIIEDSYKALLKGDVAEARRGALALAARRAPTPDDRLLNAEIAAVEGKSDEAIAILHAIPDKDEFEFKFDFDFDFGARARLREGQIELRRDRAKPAAAAFHRALELDPDLIQARRELIFIDGYRLRRPQVMEQYAALEERGAINIGDVFLWCLLRDAAWEPAEAAEKLSAWVKADPTDRESRLGLAENLRLMSQFDQAESVVSPLPDDDDDARAMRARIALQRGDIELMDRLLRGGSERHLDLDKLRGKQAQAAGQLAESARWYRLAHELDPGDRETIGGLAQVLARLGDPEAPHFRALASAFERFNTTFLKFTNARQKNTITSALLRELGQGCEGMERYGEARAWYRLALDADPLDRETQVALFRLKGKR